ncbi:hypothetical protein GBAR_LOCUS13518 [Geodia barretti]|uniref:Uncharacterized protein n=1 Tax=Geodia barretti TaxID=519541 RepID=A0AA35S6K9_GEOBA|nr:hypothetical protein GBAR_LOCUS13518 [Geodia barretti]
MPQEIPLPEDQPSDQATSAVEHSLDTLELKTTYNPLTVSSNLYHSLSVNKRGSLSKGHRVLPTGPQQQITGAFPSGRDSRSLGPRKQYNTTKTYSGK